MCRVENAVEKLATSGVENFKAMTASIITSPRNAGTTGDDVELLEMTGLRIFVTSFAGDVEAEAAMTK